MSIWAFVPPLTSDRVTSDNVEIDSAQVQLMKDADVDDLSLVWTITWDKRDKSSDPAKPPKWHGGFSPRGQTTESHRVNYLKALIAALHPKVQSHRRLRVRPRHTRQAEGCPGHVGRGEAAEDAALAATAADCTDWLVPSG